MSNDLLIDKRIIERNIKKGRLDAAEYRRMLEGLPDLQGRVWHQQEVRPQEVAQPVAQAPASAAQPPAPPAYAPNEPAAAEPASPLPSPNQPSPFG